METLDPAAEWLWLSEHYRHLTDDELLALGRQISEMTELAQQILKQEMSQRKLKLEPEDLAEPQAQGQFDVSAPASQSIDGVSDPDNPSAPDIYAKDRELVEICTVWSQSDALQVQRLLDTAGIPFFMGTEKATGVDAVTSNFTAGVKVQIMQIGVPWARQAMQHYTPADDPDKGKNEELEDVEIRCPKCRSTEVVLDYLVTKSTDATEESSSKYEWTCDDCGYQWQDEGIAKE